MNRNVNNIRIKKKRITKDISPLKMKEMIAKRQAREEAKMMHKHNQDLMP
jgi:hypothetical protein